MNIRLVHNLIVTMFCCAVECGASIAQDVSVATGGPALQEQASPGPEHEDLSQFVGSWNVTLTQGNGDRAIASSGRMRSHMMMDGRFLWVAYNVGGQRTA
ncbi:MAG: DUF1579 family protein, partial [Planctomycetota bacterium]